MAADPGEPIIRFEKVVKRFGDNIVLRELDFSVTPGERVTLIGPSGSGKTTILRLLMTLEQPDDGYIWVDGEPLWQQFNLFPNMTVLRNITEAPVRVLGMAPDEAEAKARELLDRVGLDAKADARPTELSGGQQQRVAIARALAMEPKVLLLDEVTSALDPELVTGVLNVCGRSPTPPTSPCSSSRMRCTSPGTSPTAS